MSLEAKVLSVLPALYQVHLVAEGWEHFARLMRQTFDIDHVHIVEKDLSTGESRFLSRQSVMANEFIELYEDHYGSINPFIFLGSQDIFVPGHVACDQELLTKREYIHTEFYADMMVPFDIKEGGGGTTFYRDDNVIAFLAIIYHKKPVEKDGKSMLELLCLHLAQAYTFFKEKVNRMVLETCSEMALEQMNTAVFILDSLKNVVHMNQHARHLAGDRRGLSLKNRKLIAQFPADNRKLQSVISNTLASVNSHQKHPGGFVTISQPQRHSKYRVFIFPFREQIESLSSSFERGKVLVFVKGGSLIQSFSPEIISKFYELTSSEAEITYWLSRCLTPQEISEKLHISITTTRSHMRNIFKKTDVSRQNELIAKLYTEIPEPFLQLLT
ncbi:helix-turn-helix transcriptional regulator [Hahella ganghwensis]|uniref:helix-turn-helix transcriptional regulator n=1 Tax=Hahella ganghwensis TaxID=286420 RepID=UPI0003619072|nr:helix-turn-helix transcriptional regulator [Hahella ganghwensis]